MPSSLLSSAAVASARSMSPLPTRRHVHKIVRENIARESAPAHRRKPPLLRGSDARFRQRTRRVKHTAEEYVRGDVHTNSAEGYFSIFKRGMRGVYQHCGEKHLHRYLAEYDFRYNHRVKLGLQRWRTCGACREECGWQASHVSGASLSPTTAKPPVASCAGGRKPIQASPKSSEDLGSVGPYKVRDQPGTSCYTLVQLCRRNLNGGEWGRPPVASWPGPGCPRKPNRSRAAGLDDVVSNRIVNPNSSYGQARLRSLSKGSSAMALYCDSMNVTKVNEQDAFKTVHSPGKLVPILRHLHLRKLQRTRTLATKAIRSRLRTNTSTHHPRPIGWKLLVYAQQKE